MFRDSTEIGSADSAGSRVSASNVINTMTQSTECYSNEILDEPATDSAITYRIKILYNQYNQELEVYKLIKKIEEEIE